MEFRCYFVYEFKGATLMLLVKENVSDQKYKINKDINYHSRQVKPYDVPSLSNIRIKTLHVATNTEVSS